MSSMAEDWELSLYPWLCGHLRRCTSNLPLVQINKTISANSESARATCSSPDSVASIPMHNPLFLGNDTNLHHVADLG